jgi:uncharacterized protein (TIGR03437 family)
MSQSFTQHYRQTVGSSSRETRVEAFTSYDEKAETERLYVHVGWQRQLVVPQGAIAGITSRSAKPGDTIIIYGIGLGAMTPALPIGQITEVSNTLSAPFQFYFGSTLANTIYSGLAPGQIGVYQFNVVVPAISGGDFTPISFSLGGVTDTQTLYTAVQGN